MLIEGLGAYRNTYLFIDSFIDSIVRCVAQIGPLFYLVFFLHAS